ncbi:nucleotidyltransferase family protein [Skermanella mucosa]|uniref:nucleotidyltransferase family protein n=1 Tax=Skermanella mucosa TaxID=1789672 RepID=UPI00192ACFAF|nr:nucleotidyltransferase family protein [Skermanella mucosa]UEM20767.1 nucleotidyltransferase family protein [Skermanella mucosa]
MTKMTAASRFDALVSCLRGRPPADADWVGVVEEANRYLVVPAVRAALAGWAGPEVPRDARDYLDFIHGRNHERNLRLRAQAVEAVEALNRRGIVPTLLKGACTLLTAAEDRLGDRILCDLDILVPEDGVPAALSCLSAIGYEVQPGEAQDHAPAALARRRDVGMIDLHVRPPGPARFHHPGRLARSGRVLAVGATGRAVLPSPEFRALHLIAHDMFHDKLYLSGDFELRRLVDLDGIVKAHPGLDWKEVAALLDGRAARHALEAQLVALRSLLGANVPAVPLSHAVPHFQHWRRLQQARHPGFRTFLRGIYRSSRRLGGGGTRGLLTEPPGGL